MKDKTSKNKIITLNWKGKYIKLYKVDEVQNIPTYLPTYRPAYLIYRNLLLSLTITRRSERFPSDDGPDSNLGQSELNIIRNL